MNARLLFITENYPPDRGGMGESCDRIVRGLARAGAQLDVVHFDRRAARASRQITSNGSLLRVPPDADAAHTINLLWNRLQQQVDLRATTHVVAFGGTLPLLSAPAFAAFIGRPLVTLLRGNELDTGLFDPRRRGILDDALRRSSAVCTVTTEHAEKVAALYPEVKPHVIANGIDFELWQATDADRARAAAWCAQHVEPARRVLGFFGHLKSKKGVPAFVDALVRSGLADRVHLLLIGELDDALQATLNAHAEVRHTHIAIVDRFDLLPYYLASDLIVLPSHYDGFPNVLIEAMALARPLIATTVGGMRDVLVDGEQAFLFPPGDVHACRETIARAVEATDDGLLRMGASAANVARRRCDARDETRRYLEVLGIAQEVFDAKNGSSPNSGAAARELSWRAR
jgi:glycosyltransferase involved in cell wall biosynthesis